ncbi:MAG: CDP-diacylglycerol--serine O-phosphatidyltransferase [Muribaculaceae bacterium]|nr:CDP-diacylglycerol--serine O-phosphatidyltransferase [Muribaculaceae bacterium]MBQ7204475.1 CDP-diacylglycerol--serine O-phosphatidyltransferase [Muribaculaceae bacterium]
MIKAIRNNIPNAITSLNLLFGCLACIAAFHCFDTMCGTELKGYQWAFILIALAAVADFCDGLVARALHAVSNIGAELDSLADLVSFGLAPAMVLYNIMIEQGAGHWSLVAMLLPVFGAIRLARYNTDPTQGTVFTGLPIPANAIFWIGFTAWYATYPTPLWMVLVLIVALSLLMVCNLRMFSLKMHNLSSLKENWAQYLQVVATVAFVVLMGLRGLAPAIMLYVLLSIIKREK